MEGVSIGLAVDGADDVVGAASEGGLERYGRSDSVESDFAGGGF